MTNARGYLDLKAIVDASREEQRENERAGIPRTGGMMTCPNCGSGLKSNDRGLFDCPMGDYTGPGPRGDSASGGA